MSGIVGIISQRPSEECQRLVMGMAASMKHEPFYVTGTCAIPEMGIHAGWVAQESSFAASQLFLNERRDIALIFSGECFLDSQTGINLGQRGHEIGANKAGWLVHLYEEEGKHFFEGLNGLFSGLLIDKRRRKAFLFNDRYGVERVYWHKTEDGFYFASEAKALLLVLPQLRAFDEGGVAQFLTLGCPIESRTLFRGINLLPGASLWSFENGTCQKEKYFSPEIWERQPALSAEDFQTQFEETFKRILPRYFESESKVGISLTAGLDSRMIMACLPETKKKPVCYTFSGQKRDTLDARLSSRIAKARGLDHQILRIGPDFFSNFAAYADRTVYITDGCLGPVGAHEIYMNAQARRHAPTRLTGNYGSEVLRGMSTFKPFELSPQFMNPNLDRLSNRDALELAGADENPVSFAAFREIPWRRFGVLAAGNSQVTFRTPYLDNQIVALAYQTPENFRTSSVPALRLIKHNCPALSDIPTDMGELGKGRGFAGTARRFFSKATFKLDYLFNEGLPHWMSPFDSWFGLFNSGAGVLGLHKHLHYRSWFRRELAGYVKEALADAQTRASRFWDANFLETMTRDHLSGRKNHVTEINAVLTLEAVERHFFRSAPKDVDVRAAARISPVLLSPVEK